MFGIFFHTVNNEISIGNKRQSCTDKVEGQHKPVRRSMALHGTGVFADLGLGFAIEFGVSADFEGFSTGSHRAAGADGAGTLSMCFVCQ